MVTVRPGIKAQQAGATSNAQEVGIMIRRKLKKCSICGDEYTPYSTTSKTCGVKCAIIDADNKKQKNLERSIRLSKQSERKEIRKRKEALKSKADWLKEAQTAFNAYIRKRDAGDDCISCGKSIQELKINHFIMMVCGHYLSVGAHGELRFNPLNANLQCTRCNGGAGKYGNFNNKELTVTQNYRVRLIEKIGIDNVNWLEGAHDPEKLTIDDIKEIKQYYQEQFKLLR